MTTLHFEFRKTLSHFYQNHDATLALLLDLITRMNNRNRCYPLQQTLADDLECSPNTIKAATDKLVEIGAVRLVPYEERVSDEKTLSNRRTVYEITGQVTMSGQTYPVFYYSDIEAARLRKLEAMLDDLRKENEALKAQVAALSHSSTGLEMGHSSVEFNMKPAEGITINTNNKEELDKEENIKDPPALSTKVLGIAEQVSKMQLTDPQRKILLTWLLMNHQGKETAPLTDDMSKRVMNNLVKKGILSTDEDGHYSTTLQTTETKSILAPLTYDYFGLETNASGEPVKAEQKPFWEAAAAMVAWNKLGISWKKYQQHATPNEWMAFNGEVKQLLIRFEPWHDEKAIHPHEFQAFILKQYRSWVRDKDGFSFTTTEEAITRHFPAHRVQWRIEQAEKLEAVPA